MRLFWRLRKDNLLKKLALTTSYTKFSIRTEKPKSTDKYAKCYIRECSGGWNASIQGYPTDAECDVLSNCVGYASGRFNEIYNEIRGTTGCRYKYFNGNPSSVPDRVKQFYPWLKTDKTPRPGDLIAWSDHVAICERVISDNEIVISDSAYRGAAFRFYNINNNNGNWGRSNLLCFVHNSAVEEWEDPTVTEPIPRDVFSNQIQIDMDNYSNCRQAPSTSSKVLGQFKAGYYDVLSTKVAEGYTWYQVADENWVAGTIHIKYYPASNVIEKNIPVTVIHEIPDYAEPGTEISLRFKLAEGKEIDKILINGICVKDESYVMPDDDIEIVVILRDQEINLLQVIVNIIIKCIKAIFDKES